MRPISLRVTNIALTREDTAYRAGKGDINSFKDFAGKDCLMDHADETCRRIINSYLTECWQVFDRDDESTHPKDTGIRIVRDDTNFPDVAKFEDGKWHDLYGNIVFDDEKD